MAPELEIVADGEALAARAVELFQQASPRSLALAGGSTPRRTYELLGAVDHDWAATAAVLTDERMVGARDPRLNLNMVTEALGPNHPLQLAAVETELTPSEAAARYATQVEMALPLDFAFHGLGEDGHTASLFPGDDTWKMSGALVLPATAPDGTARITLTPRALNTAPMAVFLVMGASKRSALVKLLGGEDIPASAIAAARAVVLADAEAAAQLP